MATAGLHHQLWCKKFLPATLWLTVEMKKVELNKNAFQPDSVMIRPPNYDASYQKRTNITNLGKGVGQNSTGSSCFGSAFGEQVPMFLPVHKNVQCGRSQVEGFRTLCQSEDKTTPQRAVLSLLFCLSHFLLAEGLWQLEGRGRRRSKPAWVRFERGKSWRTLSWETLWGLQDGSAGRGAWCQAWWTGLIPGTHTMGGENWAAVSSLLVRTFPPYSLNKSSTIVIYSERHKRP